MSSDLWIGEYEAIHERVCNGELQDIADIRAEFKSLGLDPDDIDGEIDAILENMPELMEAPND